MPMDFANFIVVWFMGFLPFLLKNIVPPDAFLWLIERKNAFFERWSIYYNVRVEEESQSGFGTDELYSSAHRYLAEVAKSSLAAKSMLGCSPRGSEEVHFSLAPRQALEDVYKGRSTKWTHIVEDAKKDDFGCQDNPKKAYILTAKKADRAIIKEYLQMVLRRGAEIVLRERQKRLYTNSSDRGYWSHTMFRSPATLETVAMEAKKKQALIKDLTDFKNGKEYYGKVGRAWKRGYLLYGPPGTGKSSLISAIANFTGYDIYDLELTNVKDNAELRKLLMNMKDRSIVVVEDIDCSLKLENRARKPEVAEPRSPKSRTPKKKPEKKCVTLSGLLNFTDGLWSGCGKERIFIFTTNYKEKLDPALLRPGRMDFRIEMSYCSFEVFQQLAYTYLGISDHELYPEVERLIGSVKISPAGVIEVLLENCSEVTSALRKILSVLKLNEELQNKEADKEAEVDNAGSDSSSSSSEESSD